MSTWFGLLVLLLSFPAGYILRSMTREEIGGGRQYFLVLWVGSFVLALGFLFFELFERSLNLAVIFTLLFMANVGFISWKK